MQRCNICDRDLSTIPEDGCEHCGLDYDPSSPDEGVALNFNQEPQTEYLPDIGVESGNIPIEEEDYDVSESCTSGGKI